MPSPLSINKKKALTYLNLTFLSLCFQILGIHVHTEDGSDSHQHSNDDHVETPDYTYKMLTVVGGVYVFYLMETIFSMVTNETEHHHDKGVSGDTEPENITFILLLKKSNFCVFRSAPEIKLGLNH